MVEAISDGMKHGASRHLSRIPGCLHSSFTAPTFSPNLPFYLLQSVPDVRSSSNKWPRLRKELSKVVDQVSVTNDFFTGLSSSSRRTSR